MSMLTIYSLGDHESIRAALTGVAMIFDPAKEMLGGSGILGLGHFAGFGLMVSFMFVATGIIFRQKLEFEQIIIVGIAYAALFVPKTTVTIEDMHTGQVAVVDNVPIGVAYPGGIISAFTHSVAVTLEQVMRSASSEYLPQTDVGFVAPLKLMLAARNAVTGDPYFQKNYSYFLTDCVIPGVDAKDAAQVKDPQEFLSAVISSASSAGAATLYFSNVNNEGDLRSCDSVAIQLQTDFANVFSGIDSSIGGTSPMSSVEGRVNAAMDKKPGGGKYSIPDLSQSIETLTTAGVSSQKVMNTLVLGDITYNTFRCGKAGTSDYITCTAAQAQAMEQYKFDAAGQASMAQKTMIPSMNIFMFFFYAFAPMIAIIIAMSGVRGVVKILPSYLLFGVWTQSWIPAAAIINYFIQKQVQEAIAGRLVAGDGIPLSNVMELYHTLTLKIAAASELLAYTPMLTLALLSGSMFALTKLADGAKDKFDEKTMAPDHLKVSETGSVQPRVGYSPELTTAGNTLNRGPAGTFAAGAQQGMFSLGYSSQVASSIASKETAALTTANQQLMEQSAAAGSEYGRQLAGGRNLASGTTTSATYKEGHGHAFDFGRNFAQGMKLNLGETEAKALDFSLNKMGEATTAALMQGAKMGLAGKGLKNFVSSAVKAFAKDELPKIAAKAGAALPSLSMMEQFTTQMDKTLSEQFASNEKQTDTWAAEFSTGKMSKDEKTFSDQSSMGFKSSYSERLASSKSAVQQHGEAAERANTVSKNASANMTFDERSSGRIGASSASYMERAESAVNELGLQENVQKAEAKLAKMGVFAEAGQEKQRKAAAMTWVLSQTDRAQEMAMHLAAAETAVDNMQFMPKAQDVQGSANSTFGKVDGVGPTQQDQKRIAAGAKKAEGEAGKGRQAGAAAPGAVAGAQGAAAAPVTKDDFTQMSGEVDRNAEGSGVGANNDGRVTSATPSEAFQTGSEKMKSEFRQNHGFSDLVSKFGQEVMENPALAAIAATGGAAAAYEVLSSIQKHHMAGLGGKGMTVAQYGNKVLQRLGATMLGGAGAVVGAAVAGYEVGDKIVNPALNFAAQTLTGDPNATLGGAIYDALHHVDSSTANGAPLAAAQQVVNGLSGPDPKGYIQQTFTGGSSTTSVPGVDTDKDRNDEARMSNSVAETRGADVSGVKR